MTDETAAQQHQYHSCKQTACHIE